MSSVPLHRVRSGAVLFGVCAGLGRYFDVDPVLIRVGFVLLALASGLGVVAYLLLALTMPAEDRLGLSPAQTVRDNVREMRETARGAGRELAVSLQEAAVPGRRRRAMGIGLVVLGTLLMLVNLGILSWIQWRLLWPVVLIALGLALAARR